MTNETIIDIIYALNQSGGIPINLVQTTSPYQFYLTLAISSIAFIWIFGNMVSMSIKTIFALAMLGIFKWKNKLNHVMIIKHTSNDFFNTSMINRKTLESIQQALMKFKGKDMDIILYTPGGEIFSAVYISRLLKNYKGKIRSFVPTFAMSGGTLLALSTDEIYMNDYSCLGGVDPQLGNLFKFGSARSWKEVLKLKGKKAEDSSISFKFIGEQYTKSMKETISNLLEGKVNQSDKKKLVNLFVSGEVEHGFNLSKDFLISMGMNINSIDDKMNMKLVNLIKSMPEGVTYL